MRFDGQWCLCDDGIVRPIIRGEVLACDGYWRAAEFLVDTGADRTVFSANILEVLDLEAVISEDRIGGVGGIISSIIIQIQIRLTRENNGKVVFRGKFAACTEQETLDMSVLGRDILGMFAVIVDLSGDIVCLISGQHLYKKRASHLTKGCRSSPSQAGIY
jgi:hypothetical protein